MRRDCAPNESGFELIEAAYFFTMKTGASSKVAITGGAIRRPGWHWQVLSMFKRRTALATG
jgi:hypothetical protein